MNKYVAGIPVKAFEGPIETALKSYRSVSRGKVEFDLAAATQLELTPEKPNSARSSSHVRYMGATAGTLTVIAFAPGDGTGDTKTYPLHSIDTAEFPHQSKIIPRSKAAVHTEGHLTIASWLVDEPNASPALFAGNQLLLGLDHRRVVTEGELGQHREQFQALLAGGEPGVPTATYTVGYDREEGRFADPHSVYNSHPEVLQVCGFLAIVPEAELHQELFRELNMQYPIPVRL